MLIRVQGQVPWVVRQDPVTKRFVGRCDVLGVTAEGETWKELIEVYLEIMADLFTTMFREGQLDKFLKDRHWHADLPPDLIAEDVEFDVAAPLITEQSGALA